MRSLQAAIEQARTELAQAREETDGQYKGFFSTYSLGYVHALETAYPGAIVEIRRGLADVLKGTVAGKGWKEDKQTERTH